MYEGVQAGLEHRGETIAVTHPAVRRIPDQPHHDRALNGLQLGFIDRGTDE